MDRRIVEHSNPVGAMKDFHGIDIFYLFKKMGRIKQVKQGVFII